jgi:hypothetical protein
MDTLKAELVDILEDYQAETDQAAKLVLLNSAIAKAYEIRAAIVTESETNNTTITSLEAALEAFSISTDMQDVLDLYS